MDNTAIRWLGRSFIVAATALASACANDAPVAPRSAAAVADVSFGDGNGNRLPDLGICADLAAPAGSTLILHAYGIGFQIYHWNGTSWGAATPSATLFADAGGRGKVADHFAGPTWKSNSGGTVVGTVAKRCTPDAASIPWLLLNAVTDGPGLFERVTSVQRLNTVGGNAPSVPGTFVGQEADVPYTADYLFYQGPQAL